MKQLSLVYFASVREAVGHSQETWHSQAQTLGALRDELIARGQPWQDALSRDRALRCALNHTMVDESSALPDHGEVAFFPPVTGG
jgi:sulfur-carrier protein